MAFLIRKGHCGGGLKAAATTHLHQLELIAGLRLLHLLTHDRFEVTVCDLSLAVSQVFKAGKSLIKVFAAEVVTQLFQAGTHSATAAELAEGDAVIAEAHRLGIHNFVGEPVLQHPVLMNPRLMGKGIRPNNGLVRLHHHAGEVGHQA